MKKRTVSKVLSIIMSLIIMFGMIPVMDWSVFFIETKAANYNSTAAVSFATTHAQYDIDNLGAGSGKYGSSYCSNGWLCAAFVSACLGKGGISIPNKSYYSSSKLSYNNIGGTLGSYTNPYTCSEALLVYLYECGYQIISNPDNSQIDVGDVVFLYGSGKTTSYRDDHVGICVSKSSSGTVYYAAHNSCTVSTALSSSYPCTYVAKMNGTVEVIPDKIIPSVPYAITGDSVTFTFSAVNAIQYELVITSITNNIRVMHTMIDANSYTYKFTSPGLYKIEVNAYGHNSIEGFESIYFEVHSGNRPNTYINSQKGEIYFTPQEATIFHGGEMQERLQEAILNIYKNGTLYYQGSIMSNGLYTRNFKEGTYEANVLLTYKSGYGIYSKTIRWYVGNTPQNVTLTQNVDECRVGDTITFTVTANDATEYYLGIGNGKDVVYESTSDSAVFTYTFNQQGLHYIWASAKNNFGTTLSSPSHVTVNVIEVKYIVTFNANGSIGAPSSQTKTYGTDIELSSRIPTKENYNFIGWNTKSDGTGVFYQPGDTYTQNSDLTLYAIWEHDTFSLKNDTLNIDETNGFIYGTDLFGILQEQLEAQFGNSNLKITMKDKNRVATGTMLELVDSDNLVYDTLTVVIFGDVNGDGWYDGNDAFLVNLIVNDMLDKDDVGEAVWTAADCNHDGEINEADYELLMSAGLLLNDVDQSKPVAELITNEAYIEYIGLIDQSVEITADTETNDTTVDDTVGQGLAPAETGSDFERILADIIAFVKQLFSFIFSLMFN